MGKVPLDWSSLVLLSFPFALLSSPYFPLVVKGINFTTGHAFV